MLSGGEMIIRALHHDEGVDVFGPAAQRLYIRRDLQAAGSAAHSCPSRAGCSAYGRWLCARQVRRPNHLRPRRDERHYGYATAFMDSIPLVVVLGRSVPTSSVRIPGRRTWSDLAADREARPVRSTESSGGHEEGVLHRQHGRRSGGRPAKDVTDPVRRPYRYPDTIRIGLQPVTRGHSGRCKAVA